MVSSLDKTTCPNCGNALTFNPDTQNLGCDLCEQVADIQENKKEDSLGYYIVPFQLSKKQIEEKFYQWLVNTNADTPFDIIENMRIDLVHGQYWPTWRLPIFNKKTGLHFRIVRYASTEDMTVAPAIQLIDNIAFTEDIIKPYEEAYSMGFEMVPLVTDQNTIWEKYLKDKEPNALDFHLEKDVKLCYIPIWRISYTYQNEEYVVYMDGITGKQVEGSAPKEPLMVARYLLQKRQIMTALVLGIDLLILILFFSLKLLTEHVFVVLSLLFVAIPIIAILYFSFMLTFVKTKRKEEKQHQKMKYELAKYLADRK